MTDYKRKPAEKRRKEKKKKVFLCRFCKRARGVMSRYGLNMCRRCFKDNAEKLGWEKYD